MAIVSTTIENGTLIIKVQGQPTIIIDPAELVADLVAAAALHGFKQKYVDKAALGADASAQEKYEAIKRMVDWHRDGGDWNMVGAGDGTSGDGLLVRALMEACNLSRDAARVSVAEMDKPTQHAMRQSAELAPIIARLRAEKPAPRASASVDTASVLARLKGTAS
jgi:hypothetical protein